MADPLESVHPIDHHVYGEGGDLFSGIHPVDHRDAFRFEDLTGLPGYGRINNAYMGHTESEGLINNVGIPAVCQPHHADIVGKGLNHVDGLHPDGSG